MKKQNDLKRPRFSVKVIATAAFVGVVCIGIFSRLFIQYAERANLQHAIQSASLAAVGLGIDETDPEKRHIIATMVIRNVLVANASVCSSLSTDPIESGSRKIVLSNGGPAIQHEYKFDGGNQTLDVKLNCDENGVILSNESALSFTDSLLNVNADSGITYPALVGLVLDRTIKYDYKSAITNFMGFWQPNQDSFGITRYDSKAEVDMPMSTNFANSFKLPDANANPGPLSPDEGMRLALDQMKKVPCFSQSSAQKILVLVTTGRWAPGVADKLLDISEGAREEGVTIFVIAQGPNITAEDCKTLKLVACVAQKDLSCGKIQTTGVFLQGMTENDFSANLNRVATDSTVSLSQ